jgi:hypothetical protein
VITVTQVQQEMAAAEKRRKDKDRPGRDVRQPEELLTPAHEVAQAEHDVMDAGRDDGGQAARKAMTDRGAYDGPGTFTEPGTPPGAESFARPYLDTGHAAPSPQHQPPNVAPLPPQGRGILEPLPQSAAAVVVGTGPGADAMAAHQARAEATVPRMPIPRGSA